MNGSELEYEPSLWNNSSLRSYKCYAYSLNTKGHGYIQPGQSEGHNYWNTPNYLTASVLESMVNIDSYHYNFGFERIGKYQTCDIGYYKVALVIDPVKNTDYVDSVIYDPEICDRRSNAAFKLY